MAKILVVDDSQTIRIQLKEALEGKGHKVVEAENGKQGFAAYSADQEIKLILSDVNMPELDGIGMLKQIDSSGRKKLPIIMLTTETSEQLKNTGKTLGVKAWIVKPFAPDKLLMAVEKLLAMAG